jgi:large subunit ribosomal protein L27
MGKDHTIFAVVEGNVSFSQARGGRTMVSVTPLADAAE